MSVPWRTIGLGALAVVMAGCSSDESGGGAASSGGQGSGGQGGLADGLGGSGAGSGGGGSGGDQVGGMGGGETVDAGTECSVGEPVSDSMGTLILEATGFADGVRGGVDGCVYHVTNLDDAGPGSLRDGVSGAEPTWVVFDVSGAIQAASPIEIASRKTIDGRGQSVSLEGAGLLMEDTPEDIIVHNLRFPSGSGDAITIYGGVQKVWVDHCAFGTWGDGQVDITEQSTDVTVSWSKFENHGKVMLIGASPTSTGDDAIRVTVHHNWFAGNEERHPRVRFGKVHVYNNLTTDWLYYGIGSSMNADVLSEANIFEAGGDPDAILNQVGSDPMPGRVRSQGDLLLGGAVVAENEPAAVFDPSVHYAYQAEIADQALREAIEGGAGWLDVPLP